MSAQQDKGDAMATTTGQEVLRVAVEKIKGMTDPRTAIGTTSSSKLNERLSAVFSEASNALDAAASYSPPNSQSDNWLPIATAPKDGSEILIYLGKPYDRVTIARWFSHWENWQEGSEFPGKDDEYCGIGSEVPTHWMPKPSTPGTSPQVQAELGDDRYRTALFNVCEGWNIAPDLRKYLESVLWSDTPVTDETK